MNESAGLKLRTALKGGPVLAVGVYDALSALLAEKAQFGALYLSGGALSVARLGKPDIGFLTLPDVVSVAAAITEVVKTPLLVDADTGFGGIANVERTVRELERAGAAGVQIEDQVFPKRCGHLKGKKVVPEDDMVDKIRAAVAARKDRNFLIVARTDARAVEGVSSALRRAAAYKAAGADVIFPEALQNRDEFERFGSKKGLGTLLANMTEFGRSPSLTVPDLAHLGFRLVLYPMSLFRVAAKSMEEALVSLKRDGHSRSLLPLMQTRSELYELNRYADYDRLDEMWAKKTKKRKRG